MKNWTVAKIRQWVINADALCVVSTSSGGYLHACISAADRYGESVNITLQANILGDVNAFGRMHSDARPASMWTPLWRLRDASGFYAPKAECEVGVLGESSRPSVELVQGLARLISSNVEKYNINHKYPECQLSQILEALERMGVSSINVEIATDAMKRIA